MRGFIVCVIFWCAVSGTRVPSYATQQDLLTRLQEEINKESYMSAITSTPEPISTSSTEPTPTSSIASVTNDESSLLASSSSAAPSHESSLGEVAGDLTTLSPLISGGDAEPPNRHFITYDQRQEGQYNIRADLDNFMIVLIPPNPLEGLNLLDLLTKSAYRRSHQSLSKNKRKQNSPFQLSSQSGAIRQKIKTVSGQNFNNIARVPSSNTASLVKQEPFTGFSGSQRWPEFIEGRTPYHVDISASDSDHPRVHPDRQVDVLPPPFPLAYQHLIKPFHLEAEPTVIQALPPPEASHLPANFLESYNQLLTSGLQTAAAAESSSRVRHSNDGPEIGYYRISRKIRSNNSIDSNNLSSTSNTPNRFSSFRQYLIDRYPPIDVPAELLKSRSPSDSSIQSQSEQMGNGIELHDDDLHLLRMAVPLVNSYPQDDIDPDLQKKRLLDLETMSLLSDGMERCAPGRQRDSYGMCREIEGY